MASFSQFNRFPPEIRRLIWTLSLSHIMDKPGFVVLGAAELDTRVRVQIPTPAALFVCHEARGAALSWLARNRDIEEHYRTLNDDHFWSENPWPRFWARRYNSKIDSIYIPPRQWEFVCGIMGTVDLFRMHDGLKASIINLALPAFNAYFSIEKLGEWLGQMPNLERISVLWDELPEPFSDNFRVQKRWEYEAIGENEDVRLCHTDPVTGQVSYETGNLEEYRQEMDEQWSACEDIPEQYVNVELGEIKVPYVHVRAKRAMADWT